MDGAARPHNSGSVLATRQQRSRAKWLVRQVPRANLRVVRPRKRELPRLLGMRTATTMHHQPPPGDSGITPFATTNFRGERRTFGIRDADRFFHTSIIGKTGSGKSSLLATLMRSDLERGHGFALLDPHGDLAELVLDLVPPHRIADVVYLNPADLDFPVPFNVLEPRTGQDHLIASGLVSIFQRFWSQFWGPRTEYLVKNAVLALLETPGSTLLDLSRLLIDDVFRAQVLGQVQNPAVRQFWGHEYAAYSPGFRQEAIAPIQNKAGEFILTPVLRNIVGQRRNLFELRSLMDEGRVLIVNLAKGALGEDNSALLGSMILTRLLLAALSRQDTPESERRPFFLYVDEFPNFATQGTVSALLSESRKFKIGLTLVQQYIAQASDDLRGAIFGNVGTLITFRCGAEDAVYLAREFRPIFTSDDLVNLPRYDVALKLNVHGVSTTPFSASTLPPQPVITSHRSQIIQRSRERYARPRVVVERSTVQHFVMPRGAPSLGPALRP